MDIDAIREIERLIRSGQREKAEAATKQAEASEPSDPWVQLARATVSYYGNRLNEAIAAARQALAAYQTAGDKLGEGYALRAQADILRLLCHYDEALTAAKAATALFREAGDKRGEGSALRTQAEVLRMLGRVGGGRDGGEGGSRLVPGGWR